MIRKARAKEAAKLAEIGFRAWDDKLAVWTSGHDDVVSIRENARNAYLTFAHNSWEAVRVAEDDGRIVGWGAREHRRDVANHRDNAISDLWIDPEWQGRGYGKALLALLEEEVQALGFSNIVLETHARNQSAIGFYQAHGYAIRWLSTVYSAALDRDIEKVGMEKQLSADPPPSDTSALSDDA